MKTIRYILCAVLLSVAPFKSFAQSVTSPYETSWKKDATWLGLGLAGTATGFLLIQGKEGFTEQQLANLDVANVNGIDRFAAGNYDENASKISDIPFYTSFAIPLALMATKGQNENVGQLSVMYLEALSTSAALFTISPGLTNGARPKAYNNDLSLEERMETTNTRSFFLGTWPHQLPQHFLQLRFTMIFIQTLNTNGLYGQVKQRFLHL